MVRKMLVKVLIMLGSQVDEANDGQVAIDIIREKLSAPQEETAAAEVEVRETAGKEAAAEEEKEEEEKEEEEEEKKKEKEEDAEKQSAAAMPYDLILMDSIMPRVSGLEATETIVRELGFTNVVVGVTGNILPADTRGTSTCV
jgi:CheY-like chemotaxis protein